MLNWSLRCTQLLVSFSNPERDKRMAEKEKAREEWKEREKRMRWEMTWIKQLASRVLWDRWKRERTVILGAAFWWRECHLKTWNLDEKGTCPWKGEGRLYVTKSNCSSPEVSPSVSFVNLGVRWQRPFSLYLRNVCPASLSSLSFLLNTSLSFQGYRYIKPGPGRRRRKDEQQHRLISRAPNEASEKPVLCPAKWRPKGI